MKFFKYLYLIFLLLGCSNVDKNLPWEKSINTMNYAQKLQVGDIIIKKKYLLSPYGWFGHSAVVASQNKIGEYPKIGLGYCETGILDWLYNDREIIVLRYKHFDENFKQEFLKNIKKYKGKVYRLGFDKYNSNYFYCSKYVWLIYMETAEALNYSLDFYKYKNQLYVYPYDFLFSKDFEAVEL